MPKINITAYQVGTIVNAASARVAAEKTSPPAYYTEATLLEDMVNAYKYAPTEQDREALKATNGIGTARTRGEAIKELINSKFLYRDGKGKKQVVKDSPAGRMLTKIAPAAMKSVAMTAKWEMLFSKIEKGELAADQFQSVIRKFISAIIDSARKQKEAKGGHPVWNHARNSKAQ